MAPPEELIWHRLFINERHRRDMADIVHLIFCRGQHLDWDRLVAKCGEHWPLLLAELLIFRYVYPAQADRVPEWVLRDLPGRARQDAEREPDPDEPVRGTLISRFSFAIGVNEWGLRDLRDEKVAAVRRTPLIEQIVASDVWDERGEAAEAAP